MAAPIFIQTLKGQSASRPPLWLMRQAGRYLPEYRELRQKTGSFLDLCYTPELACEVTLQPIRRFGFDAAILFSDILVIPDALGQRVEFREGEGPVLEPLTSASQIDALDRTKLLQHLSPVFEAIELIRSKLGPEIALIGFCGAPWTVATYMIGGRGSPDQAAARLMAYTQPEVFARLMNLLVDVSADYLCAQIDAGAQALQIFDSWAGTLPDEQFRRWCLKPARHIVDKVKKHHANIPIIGFPRGAGPLCREYAQESGVDALGCDTSLALDWIRDELQPILPVQGNLDPLLLVAGGERLDERVEKIMTTLQDAPYIFNLGHGIVPQTPIEHVARLVKLVRGE